MDDNVGNTQERPALRNARRRTNPASVQNPTGRSAGQSYASSRGASGSRPPRQARPTSADQQRGRHPYAQNDRRYADKGSKKQTPQRRGVPLVAVLIIVVVCVAATFIITRSVYVPRIEEAERQTTQAKRQVTTLTQQLSKISDDSQDSSSSDSDVDSDTSSSSTSSSSSSDSSSKPKTGTAKASSGVEDPWTTSGTYTSGDSVLDGEVKAFVDSVVDSSMNKDAAALEMYKAIAWSDYVERETAQHPSGKNWRTQYARMYYENGCSGNCYEFASFLSFCLQYMGFEDATAQGVEIELQGGSWGDHGIVYVTNTDGTACLCDTARGTNGWMLPQGSYNVHMVDFENA